MKLKIERPRSTMEVEKAKPKLRRRRSVCAREAFSKIENALRGAQQRSAAHSSAQAIQVEQTNPPILPVRRRSLARFERLRNEPTLSYKCRPKATRCARASLRIIL